jgi:hypothetical protein
MLLTLPPSARELADYLSSLSEGAYRAGWMDGLEFELWEAVISGPREHGRLQITRDHIAQLQHLSEELRAVAMPPTSETQTVPLGQPPLGHTLLKVPPSPGSPPSAYVHIKFESGDAASPASLGDCEVLPATTSKHRAEGQDTTRDGTRPIFLSQPTLKGTPCSSQVLPAPVPGPQFGGTGSGGETGVGAEHQLDGSRSRGRPYCVAYTNPRHISSVLPSPQLRSAGTSCWPPTTG